MPFPDTGRPEKNRDRPVDRRNPAPLTTEPEHISEYFCGRAADYFLLLMPDSGWISQISPAYCLMVRSELK